jgi:hypothetical protein
MALVGWLGIAACDNTLSPGKPSLSNTPRYGDFVIEAVDYTIPDTVKMGDTVLIPFRIGGGAGPCSLVGPMWILSSRVFYHIPWGVNSPGPSCRTPAFRVWGPNFGEEPKVDSVRGDRIFYGDNRDIVYRVIICRPDGSYDRKDIVVLPPWPTRGRIPENEDLLRKIDARECRGLTRNPGT